MFCKHCGAQMEDTTLYCPSCGKSPVESTIPQSDAPAFIKSNTNGTQTTYKNKWATFFLCLFLGEFGIHRFYTGKIGTGILWLLTLGIFGIGVLVDLIMLLTGSFKDSNGNDLITN